MSLLLKIPVSLVPNLNLIEIQVFRSLWWLRISKSWRLKKKQLSSNPEIVNLINSINPSVQDIAWWKDSNTVGFENFKYYRKSAALKLM